MRALTVIPEQPGSLAVLEVPEPDGPGGVVVDGVLLGVCGTDRLITRRIPLPRTAEAFQAHEDDVKVVIELRDAR